MDAHDAPAKLVGPAANAPGMTDTLIKGRPIRLRSLTIDGQEIVVSGRLMRTARLLDEWYEDVENPEVLIRTLQHSRPRADIFTFWQRLPDTAPRYPYRIEWNSIAALPLTSFEDWWKRQLSPKTRNLIRKSAKMGLDVKSADFDEDFIQGITDIFNETPIRQDKRFWHYGKHFETVKREFSRNLYREDLFGAYHQNTLVGFMFLGYASRYALIGQILSKIAHRDKAPNNALVAKAVAACASKGIPYLVYATWSEGSLGLFKRNCGFERIDLPRYYVPLTLRGKILLTLRLHRGLSGAIPQRVKRWLVAFRRKWHSRHTTAGAAAR
jgi:hypothetical protein